jgi:hypothetical protein
MRRRQQRVCGVNRVCSWQSCAWVLLQVVYVCSASSYVFSVWSELSGDSAVIMTVAGDSRAPLSPSDVLHVLQYASPLAMTPDTVLLAPTMPHPRLLILAANILYCIMWQYMPCTVYSRLDPSVRVRRCQLCLHCIREHEA